MPVGRGVGGGDGNIDGLGEKVGRVVGKEVGRSVGREVIGNPVSTLVGIEDTLGCGVTVGEEVLVLGSGPPSEEVGRVVEKLSPNVPVPVGDQDGEGDGALVADDGADGMLMLIEKASSSPRKTTSASES